jgi:hypothetical protein
VSYRVEPLAASHDLDAFDCGLDALNGWLRQHARRATGQGTRTYLLTREVSAAGRPNVSLRSSSPSWQAHAD